MVMQSHDHDKLTSISNEETSRVFGTICIFTYSDTHTIVLHVTKGLKSLCIEGQKIESNIVFIK